ncbi:MAG: bifunctional oligoribonuclease/PAP phosphatase NrnA [Treponema sp.]|nr:bifunctional oligoribonuclease/PAP phosphatase NrnA [Spirochaetales bacterium]MDY4902150.1 bifunctional oligoribonuclease/PAP phosphatase NrnA [Treponema sp.]
MEIISQEKIQRFKNFIDSHKSFIIAGHKEPDGDCISSCMGLSFIIEKTGKPFVMINAGPFKRSEIRSFGSHFTSQLPFMTQTERDECGFIMTDCSEISRIGEIDGDLKGFDTFIIDHHKTASVQGDDNIIDPSAPAAACLVLQLFEALNGKPSPKQAEMIFLGIATDTGYFRFLTENSAQVFNQTASLVEAGANPKKIYQEITGGKPWNTRKLLGIMLERAERQCNGKLVTAFETMEDTKKFGQDGRDSDSFYSLMLAVEGVEAVLFVRQDTEYTCTLGLRSNTTCDVSKIAAKFGGGGHKNASGASCEGKIETILPLAVKEFAKFL